MTMQVQVAETGPCSRSLTIHVPAESIREHVDAMYRSANRQVRMKGFRPGKVPRKMLEKQLGGDILKEAKEQIVNRYFNEACREKELVPVGRVTVDEFDELVVEPGSNFEFTVKLDVRPDFELGKVEGLEAAAFATEVTDADIDNALQEIANQRRAIRKVEGAAEKGDFVKVDMEFRDDAGAQVHERKGVQLNTSIPIAGTDQAAFEAALTGAEAGKTIELPLTFPDNFEKDEYRGKSGTAALSVLEVLRVTAPPIDDELAKALEFDDLAALRADLTERIGAEKVRIGKQGQEDECLQQLLDQHAFELPSSLVEEQQRASLAQFAQRLQQSGMTEAEVEQKLEEAKADARQDAERRVRLFFLIDAVARKQQLRVDEADLEAEIKKIAAANQATPGQVREYLEKNNQSGELRLAILERKVRDFLRDNAKIVDRKGN